MSPWSFLSHWDPRSVESRPTRWRIVLVALPLALGAAAGARAQRFGALHEMFPSHEPETGWAHVLVDADGDGDLDVVVGKVDEQNRLYLNDGTALLRDATDLLLPQDSDPTYALAAGDVNGDGHPDLVVGNGHGEQNRLYLNDGTGSFSDVTGTHLPVDADRTRALALEDMDGDGDLDLVVGNKGQQDRLYLNDGSGSFSDATATHFPPDAEKTYALDVGDVDGDGRPDLVLGNPGRNRLYLNDGTGRFRDLTATRMPDEEGRTRALALGDLDGDGALDLVVGNHEGPTTVLLNDGAGVFGNRAFLRQSAEWPGLRGRHPSGLDGPFDWATRTLVLGDVDGDGDLDLVAGKHGVPGMDWIVRHQRLYLNDGEGHLSDATGTHMPPTGAARGLALGDLDGDGDGDLVFWSALGYQRNRLFLNDGKGVFHDGTGSHLPAGSDKTSGLALGDVDGDGDPDLALATIGFQDHLYLNDGTGVFVDATETHLPKIGSSAQALVMGDVDGDGDRDLVLGNTWGVNTILLLNDGTGRFTNATATHMPDDSAWTTSLALGDVDGDGSPDLVLGNFHNGAEQNQLYLNDGNGVFSDVTTTHMPALEDGTAGLALGDVDGDRHLDLVVADAWQNRLYLNDGVGVFRDVTTTHMPVDLGSGAVALRDVDADGDLDILFANGSNPDDQNRLYLNDGKGVFKDATATHLPVDSDSTGVVALGDVDGDGDPDVLFGNRKAPDRLYLNDGRGFFSDATAEDLPERWDNTRALAVGDVDGDGDPDLLLGNYAEQNRLVHNLSRQLAWRGLPRVGKPLTMDLWGPPNAPWVLSVSTLEPPPAGGAGGLSAAAAYAFVAGGVLGPDGRDSFTQLVPADAGLVGTTWTWWARVGGLPTNRERTTFTDL